MMLFAPSPMGGLYNGEQLKSHEDDSVMKALRHLMISMLLTLASVGPAAAALPTTLPDGQNLPSLAPMLREVTPDRKSTRLNSSHVKISYAVFCLKKKKRRQVVAEPETRA